MLACTAQHFSLPADRVLDPLLDEALSVAGAEYPTDLSQRIVKATQAQVPAPALVIRAESRVQWRRWAIAAAAAIAVSAFVVGALVKEHQTRQENELAMLESHVDESASAALELIRYREPAHQIDHEIVQARRAADRLQGSLTSGSDWQDAWASLDQTLRDEFDPGL